MRQGATHTRTHTRTRTRDGARTAQQRRRLTATALPKYYLFILFYIFPQFRLADQGRASHVSACARLSTDRVGSAGARTPRGGLCVTSWIFWMSLGLVICAKPHLHRGSGHGTARVEYPSVQHLNRGACIMPCHARLFGLHHLVIYT